VEVVATEESPGRLSTVGTVERPVHIDAAVIVRARIDTTPIDVASQEDPRHEGG
jgi:hypothetical protein